MRRRKIKKLFTAWIALILLVQSMGTTSVVVAQEISNAPRQVNFTRPRATTKVNTQEEKKDPFLREPQKYYEEEALPEGNLIAADDTAKVYQIDEKNFVTEIGGANNTYEDSEGDLQKVDNTLLEKRGLGGSEYQNTANDYTVKLPAEITAKKGVTLQKDKHIMELIPTEGDFSNSVAVDNAILFNNVFEGIDYQYTVLGDAVKEDIVLNKPTDIAQFQFEIKAEKLKLEQRKNAIIAYEEADLEKTPVFSVSAPLMTDTSGEVNTDIQLILKEEQGKYIGTLLPNKKWLDSAERAYPVRIDPTINVSRSEIGLYGVEQGTPDTVVGDNGYPYVGYDDGVISGNIASSDGVHLMTRTYVQVDYDFKNAIPKEAQIQSATFSLKHYTNWSNGKTNFGLYEVDRSWNPNTITWNNQKAAPHTFIQFQRATQQDKYLDWNVEDTVNNWVQGIKQNRGFVVKAQDERNMQCEVFLNKASGSGAPKFTVQWQIPDPVDPNYPLNNLNITLRPISEKNVQGKLKFDGIFADGVAKPESVISYWLQPDNAAGVTNAGLSYKYPDSTPFESEFPNGTKYKAKDSNWQSSLYKDLSFDKAYKISAKAFYGGGESPQKDSEKFLIYQVKQKDTFPHIARHYGVPLDTIMRDNRVQDTLVIDNNTLFIRNPNTEVPYNPPPLSTQQKKEIDSALMGRGMHCEYGFEPINLNTGNFLFETTDASIPDLNGGFSLVRTYNSKGEAYNSLFGRRWSFAYDESLYMLEDGTIGYSKGDGKTLFFTPKSGGGYVSPEGFFLELTPVEYTVGKEKFTRHEIKEKDGTVRKFDSYGLLTEIIDVKNLTTKIEYDENYNLQSITSPSGKAYGFTVDNMGRISTVKLPNLAVLKYKYDNSGNLTEFTDAEGQTVRYVYDENNRMTEWYDQEGRRVIQNSYDTEGRVTKQLDGNGREITLIYSPNKTVTTDAEGNQATYYYDENYRTTKIEKPDGQVIEKSYGDQNTLKSDHKTQYEYDQKGNVTKEIREDGREKIYRYNLLSLPIKITDFDGKVTEMKYDDWGNLTKLIRPDGKTEKYTYDAFWRVTSHKNPLDKTEEFTYDGANLASYRDFRGNITHCEYNSMNQLITSTDPLGNTTQVMYNKRGDKIGELAADGGYTEYNLDKVGNPICITDPKGYATDFVLDGMYNIIEVTDPQGNVTQYTFDNNQNQTGMTTAEGYTTTYEYDEKNRLIKEANPEGGFTEYVYDEDDFLTESKNSLGKVIKNEYNRALGIPVKKTDPLGSLQEMKYSDTGELLQMTNPDATTVLYEYDDLGQITRFRDSGGKVSEFTYDAVGNITTLEENGKEYTYQYDGNNNLTKTIDPLGQETTMEYDACNRLVVQVDEKGNREVYTYDSMGRVVETENALGHITTMSYDLNGNLEVMTDAESNSTTYYYDRLNHLLSEEDPLGNVTNYLYDKAENLIETTMHWVVLQATSTMGCAYL